MSELNGVNRALRLVAAFVLGLGLPGAAAAGTRVAPAGVQADVVVTFTDSTLRITPAALQAGTATFFVVNKGKRRHALLISGPELKGVHSGTLRPGRSATLKLKLRTGWYRLADPLGLSHGHAGRIQVKPGTLVSGSTGSTVAAPPGSSEMCGGVIP
jgi:hypothetical protein